MKIRILFDQDIHAALRQFEIAVHPICEFSHPPQYLFGVKCKCAESTIWSDAVCEISCIGVYDTN